MSDNKSTDNNLTDNNNSNSKSNNSNNSNNKSNTNSSNNKSLDNNLNKSSDNNTNTKSNNTSNKSLDNNKNSSNTKSKLSDNILLYVIIFAILFIVLLIVLTWTLDVISKLNSCQTYPNIWCSDKWICNQTNGGDCGTSSNGGDDDNFRQCFIKPTATKEPTNGESGLAQCLFGMDSFLGQFQTTYCGSTGSTGVTGDCLPCNMTTTNGAAENNCLLGCPAYGTGSGDQSTTCCCCPGTRNCNITRCDYCAYLKSGATDNSCFEKIKSQDTTINAYCRVDCTTPCPDPP